MAKKMISNCPVSGEKTRNFRVKMNVRTKKIGKSRKSIKDG